MKELACRDVGFDCDGVVSGGSEDDVMTQVAAHAKEVHGLSDAQVTDPGFAQQVKVLIRDTP